MTFGALFGTLSGAFWSICGGRGWGMFGMILGGFYEDFKGGLTGFNGGLMGGLKRFF